MEPKDENVIPLCRGLNYYHAGAEVVRQGALSRYEPTAIAALNDQVGAGILCGCCEAGIQVPDDLSLIGAEGLPEAEFLAVPLTTVAFPMDDVAEQAVAFLAERIGGYGGSSRRMKVAPRLEERKSCARLVCPAPSAKERDRA
jgi:LacI family transcriptional regulator